MEIQGHKFLLSWVCATSKVSLLLLLFHKQRKTKVFVKTYLSLGDLNLEGLEMGLSFLGRDWSLAKCWILAITIHFQKMNFHRETKTSETSETFVRREKSTRA